MRRYSQRGLGQSRLCNVTPVPDYQSAECRLVASLARVLPEGSTPRDTIREAVQAAPETQPGEAAFTTDIHSLAFTFAATIPLIPLIGCAALIDNLYGRMAARRFEAFAFAPLVFFMALALLLQIAKFRKRFDGCIPLLGRPSWVTAFAAPLTVALMMWPH